MRLGAAKDDFYEVHPRKGSSRSRLISDVLPLGRLWYGAMRAAAAELGRQSYNDC
jgi:hypothetical protein